MARKPLTKSKLDKMVGREQTTIPVSKIRRDGATQPRARMDDETVAEYAGRMSKRRDGMVVDPEGEPWRELTVYYDGESYWLADGFHRAEAARVAGVKEFQADVRQGTQREAFIFSLSANAKHGLRRSNEDKRRVVRQALWDPELKTLSDGEIGRLCGVSQPFVSKIRRELAKSDDYVPPSFRQGADGKTYEVEKITDREPTTRQNSSDVGIVRRRSNGKVETLHTPNASEEVKTGDVSMRWLEGDYRTHMSALDPNSIDIVFTQEAPDRFQWGAIIGAMAKPLRKDGLFITMSSMLEITELAEMLGRRGFSAQWIGVIRWLGQGGPPLTAGVVWSRTKRPMPQLHEYWELSRDFGGRQSFARRLLEKLSGPGDVLVDPQAGLHVGPIVIPAAALGIETVAIEADRDALREAKRMAGNLLQ